MIDREGSVNCNQLFVVDCDDRLMIDFDESIALIVMNQWIVVHLLIDHDK